MYMCIYIYTCIQLPDGQTPPPCQGMNGIKDTEEDGINVFLGIHKTGALIVLAKQGSTENGKISCALLNVENDKCSDV